MNTEELNLVMLGMFSIGVIPALYWIFNDPSTALNSYLSQALLGGIILAYSGMAIPSPANGRAILLCSVCGLPVALCYRVQKTDSFHANIFL